MKKGLVENNGLNSNVCDSKEKNFFLGIKIKNMKYVLTIASIDKLLPIEIIEHELDIDTEEVSEFDDTEVIRKWFIEFIDNILEDNRNEVKGRNERLCNDIIDYLKENYAKDISLNDISNEFYLTPNYISTIFKKTTGVSFKNQLTHIRIEKAKELIKNTTSKFSEIHELVGYKNYEHFRKVFRNATGVNPSEY